MLNACRAEDWRSGEKLAQGFRVRRFAGPRVHTDQLDHVRVVHLTDLHVGRMTPMDVQYAAVALANAERPDVVCITGDLVCHSQAYLTDLQALIARFEAPVFCVLGNHDHWSGADEVRAALRRGGAEVLDNRHTTIDVRGQRLQIVGLDDAYTGHASGERATLGLRRDMATLGLSHIAEQADGLWASGIPLVLAGHTHGGQVTFARLHEIILGRIAGHRYLHGLYGARRSAGAVYVGAGVGAAVMPLRVGARGQREITVFELGHQQGSFEEHHDEQRARRGRDPRPRKIYRRAARVVRAEQRRLARAARQVASAS